MNIYNEIFQTEVEKCAISETYIGTGNPKSKILIVGKETAIDINNENDKNEDDARFQNELLEDYNSNARKWKDNIKNQIKVNSLPNWIGGKDSPLCSNPLFPFKSLHPNDLKEGQTWRKYQKLHDLIFLKDISKVQTKEFDFHNNFFLTEMNNNPAKKNKNADKSGIRMRKELIKNSEYFQNFHIVILACSNYITGVEIEEIFRVRFDAQYGFGNQLFWTHYNSNRTKIVIHTRQLSNNVSDELLKGIADQVHEFL